MNPVGIQTAILVEESDPENGYRLIAQAGFDCIDFNLDAMLPGEKIQSGDFGPLFRGEGCELESGLKAFYKETGVQPYIYIASKVDGTSSPTVQQISDYSDSLYSKLFTDEAHFLVVFCDNGNGSYMVGYTVGSQAKTILDSEALSIFHDYLDRYYNTNSSSMSDEEFFSKTFSDTADRIMTVTTSPWPKVLLIVAVIAAAVILVVVLYKWRQKAREAKEREEKRTQEILNTPLEKFGDKDLDDLAKKYEKNGSGGTDAKEKDDGSDGETRP